jgi:hypothetical protein
MTPSSNASPTEKKEGRKGGREGGREERRAPELRLMKDGDLKNSLEGT